MNLSKNSLLSKPAILKHLKAGNISIIPFSPENIEVNLKGSSYDVRLGEFYFEEKPFRAIDRQIFNPFDPSHIKKYWGEPQKAIRAGDWMKKNGPLVNIYDEDQIIIVGAGETILAHTQEFIGGGNCINTEMRARSSMGRIGITVCKCAGWGDPGYCCRWTMELSNHLKDTSVLLLVGMRVAQMIFYQVDPVEESYVIRGGQYQTTDNSDEMVKSWSPYMMLPKFDHNNP